MIIFIVSCVLRVIKDNILWTAKVGERKKKDLDSTFYSKV